MEEKKVIVLFVPVMALSLLVTAFSANQIVINDITCKEAINLLEPCKDYLEGKGPDQPSDECCAGAKTVDQRANSTQNQKDVCECLKGEAEKLHVVASRASDLLKLCKINIIIPPTPDVNCSNANSYYL